MFNEKRNVPRIDSHIMVEMNLPGQFPRYCGYIENLCENGIGIISLDSFPTGTNLIVSFVIPGIVERITTNANIVRIGPNVGMLNYYAFTLKSLDEADRLKINQYIRENAA